jgi:DNA (cytosine-5)-methyltransferase 1
MTRAYYNENDPKAAAWLRELIKQGCIAKGEVDTRSIEDVTPSDLNGFSQCHFFAGIGGWSYALRLAGWTDDRPVWTGSCPCQPFSTAGKGKGIADERHLWPALYHLIQQCRPAVVFGEQVASPDGLAWFDIVQADLEDQDYACGAADLCAAGVGAPHIRQRLYWMAYSSSKRLEGHPRHDGATRRKASAGSASKSGAFSRVQHTESDGWKQRRSESGRRSTSGGCFWLPSDWIDCRDGKARPIEPGTFPLANGVSGRVGLLRGYGNAIVPEVATLFIQAGMEYGASIA